VEAGKGKVAPTLRWLAAHDWSYCMHKPVLDARQEAERWNSATRELRLLLSVVRAAERELLAVLEVAREARNTHQGELDGNRLGRLLEDSSVRIARALSRLRSSSARAGRKP